VRHKQGHEVWVDLLVSAERGPEGEIAYLVAVVQDVSERKRTEMELELAQFLTCSSDGVIIAPRIGAGRDRESRLHPHHGLHRAGSAGSGLDGESPPRRSPLTRSAAACSDESVPVLLRGRRDGELLWSEIRWRPSSIHGRAR
jgi:hypothetical protein